MMGREIRRVPSDWEHPKYTKDDAPGPDQVGDYRSLYDEDYETVAEKWLSNLGLWQRGEHPSQPCEDYRYLWEYEGGPPDSQDYRDRKWSAEEATHYQVYETVSEGSPVTPVFATKPELVDYLVENGEFWDQERGNGGWDRTNAERFVETEYAPSLMVMRSATGTVVKEPRDGIF